MPKSKKKRYGKTKSKTAPHYQSWTQKPKKSMTANQREFIRLQKQIMKRYEKLNKEGFQATKDFSKILATPQKVTKARLEKLKSMQRFGIYKKLAFVNPKTGEVLDYNKKSDRKRIKEIRKENQKPKEPKKRNKTPKNREYKNNEIPKIDFDAMILLNIIREIESDHYHNKGAMAIADFLKDLIRKYGERKAGAIVSQVKKPLPSYRELYNSGYEVEWITEFLNEMERLELIDEEERKRISLKYNEEENGEDYNVWI